MDVESFSTAVKALGIALTPEQIDRFVLFEQALYAANEVMNLTRVSIEDCWRRHFLDSLLFQDLIPKHAFVLDIGTGPGFPSWPLACARPDIKITTIDSNGKMIGFLRQMSLPNITNVKERAEDWKVNERFDFASSDRESFENVDLEPLGLKFIETVERPLPGTDVVRLFPIYQKVAKTKIGFPRRWAEIKAYPL